VSLNNKDGSISFSALEKSWKFDPVKGLVEDTNPAGKFNKSPDGKLGVFFKDQTCGFVTSFRAKKRKLRPMGAVLHVWDAARGLRAVSSSASVGLVARLHQDLYSTDG